VRASRHPPSDPALGAGEQILPWVPVSRSCPGYWVRPGSTCSTIGSGTAWYWSAEIPSQNTTTSTLPWVLVPSKTLPWVLGEQRFPASTRGPRSPILTAILMLTAWRGNESAAQHPQSNPALGKRSRCSQCTVQILSQHTTTALPILTISTKRCRTAALSLSGQC
jgi:hypothetical protein